MRKFSILLNFIFMQFVHVNFEDIQTFVNLIVPTY